MIIQGLLDWFSVWLAGLIDLIPDLPPSLQNAIVGMDQGAAQVGAVISKFGVLLPYDVVAACFGGWVAMIAYWGAVLVVRLVLFVMGR